MSFISYAQNFEDVMLWRALKHVEKGFYIDVGANDPVIDSVTKAFYENGWCGINIEPLSPHHADLVRDRPRDINLCCAAGASAGEVEVWETDVRGWATADKNVIVEHAAAGHAGTFHRVAMRTLADICIEHSHREIHFLKIDVEGFEKSVLQGADFAKYRPWIVVIEATKPNSTIEVYADWEPLILKADYQFVYADGLNRFYLAKEHEALRQQLIYPPNPFDNFIRSQQLNSELRAQAAEAQAQQASERATSAEAQAQQASERAASAETQALQANDRAAQAETASNAIYGSRSWRVTAPARWLAMQTRLLQKDGLIRRVKALIKKIAEPAVRRSMVFLDTRPALRSRCLVLARKTGLYKHLRSLFFGSSLPSLPLHALHEGKLASLRMMSEVDLAIKNTDSTISVIYLEME